jgi:ligand-binding sensor domain-containing protein
MPKDKKRIQLQNLITPVILLLIVAGLAAFFLLRPAPPQIEYMQGITHLLQNDEFSAVELFEGDVWCGGREGLYCIKQTTHEIIFINEEAGAPNFRYVRDIIAHKGELWVAYDGGVAKLQNGAWLTVSEGLPDKRMTSLCLMPNGNMWAGCFKGAVLLSPKLEILDIKQEKDGLVSDMVNVISLDNSENIWFGSYLERPGVGGLSILYKDGNIEIITDENGLPHHDITCILPLKNGDVWVGCGMLNRGGAARLSLGNNGRYAAEQVLTLEDGLAGEKVRFLFENENDIWFCSESDGIAIYNGSNFTNEITKENALSDNEIKDIIKTQNGTLYLAGRYGLTCITPAALQKLMES